VRDHSIDFARVVGVSTLVERAADQLVGRNVLIQIRLDVTSQSLPVTVAAGYARSTLVVLNLLVGEPDSLVAGFSNVLRSARH
jgi:hypothetical protein